MIDEVLIFEGNRERVGLSFEVVRQKIMQFDPRIAPVELIDDARRDAGVPTGPRVQIHAQPVIVELAPFTIDTAGAKLVFEVTVDAGFHLALRVGRHLAQQSRGDCEVQQPPHP